jgi:TP53 regulating kinase-like protein
LTTSNILCPGADLSDLVLIDFGLAAVTPTPENRAVDLYVLQRAVRSTHTEAPAFWLAFEAAYRAAAPGAEQTLRRLEKVRQRGRKADMSG